MRSIEIGKFCVIEDGVEIGEGTKIGNYVLIKMGTKIGKNNIIYSGAQIGTNPQDYHFKGEYSECVIGDNNIIREYATISRATGEGQKTIIGSNNFIMTYVHIAHNCKIGNNTIIASGTQIGGYVEIDDFVNIGGLCGIHQFCRIGKYSMLGAKSYLNKDLPPYLLAAGNRARIYGVNFRGLLKNSFSTQEIEEIKKMYRIIYRDSYNLTRALAILKQRIPEKIAFEFIRFVENSKRGILLK
uniref:Acyl-ACP--UDP-N-acetylglucosamine O-acyltransferase n=1 Tax=candidate division WOR-3 bacterium TaxID=2052148 RepID=A0A7C4XJN2_UNCW3